ncbi:MAG: bifunctional DNA-formamidopyrimidine glycosylase/DNA-(apurinic or apyrimidinic site) lyase [Brachymonas sp.]|nr:bifunctional DNA-formamidopyrimidine glycosylase/DNA-(apurinic or apyrimidinic site) lyase [Brachymonas sp.]
MPELPEVEVTRRSFANAIAGSRIVEVRLGKPLRWPLGVEPHSLHGRQVLAVRRRGKYLLLDMDEGLLMVHLGMSGSLRFGLDLPPAGTHDHFSLHTTQGILRLNDPRRFGCVMAVASENDPKARKLLDGLGMEPLGEAFDAGTFYQQLRRSRSSIKQVLLVGRMVVGVGNIYASEALFKAGIHPEKVAARMSRKQVQRLWQTVREVMHNAIEEGGSSLRNYSNALGRNGNYQSLAYVYGRQGQPCRICGHTILMIRQGQRSTYFCPHCQKRQ